MLRSFYQWLKSYLLYAHTDPNGLAKVGKAVYRSNRGALYAYSRIAVVIFFFATIFSQILGLDTKIAQNSGYIFGFVCSLTIFLSSKFLVPRYPALLLPLVYAFDLVLFGFGFLLAFVCSLEQLTISLLIMFAIVPMFFTDRPPRIVALYVVLELVFAHMALLLKPAEIRNLEVVNMLVYSNVGLILGFFMTRMKFERFIFENRVAELTNQEQLVRYLKSISTIYLCMHHADLDTGLFVEIRSTERLNATLESLDRNFGHQLVLGIKMSAAPDYLESALKFVDLSTVKERLKGKRTITHEYLSKDKGWCRARFVNADQDKINDLPRYVIFAVENIDEQKRREHELISQAETDAMTGLLNRSGGVSKIKEVLFEGKKGLLCLFDVDKFKSINDTYGHQVGDLVIEAVANAMRSSFRDGDILLRLGGDEYMVFLNKIVSEEQGSLAIARFFTELSNTVVDGLADDYRISVSLGATFFKGDVTDFEELYKQVDSATYDSKKIEGRSFTFYRG